MRKISHLRANGEKILLLMDGHASHMKLYVLEVLQRNDIMIIAMSPHISYTLEPMNLSVFEPLKSFLL